MLVRALVFAAEVAGAEKSDDVVVPVGVEVDTEATEAQVSAQQPGVDAALAKVEHGGVVADGSSLRVYDLVDLNRRVEAAAQMKEPDLKADIRSAPEASLRTKADRLVSIPVQFGQNVR